MTTDEPITKINRKHNCTKENSSQNEPSTYRQISLHKWSMAQNQFYLFIDAPLNSIEKSVYGDLMTSTAVQLCDVVQNMYQF